MPLFTYPRTSKLYYSEVATPAVTGTTTPTTLSSVVIPGRLLGPNGILVMHILWTMTNSANSKTLKIKFGGTSFYNTVFTATGSFSQQYNIFNRNSTGSQVAGGDASNGVIGTFTTTPIATGSIDTTVDQTLLLEGTLANTGENITVRAFGLQILRPN